MRARMKPLTELEAFNIIVTGVGGQGNILASRIIADAAMKAGLRVSVGETFGASQRGGSVVSHIRIGTRIFAPLVSPNEADTVIGLEPIETLRAAIDYACENSMIIFNIRPVLPAIVKTKQVVYPELRDIIHALQTITPSVLCLDAYEIAIKAGNPVVMSVVMLGAFAGTKRGPIPLEAYESAIRDSVGEKWIKTNLDAFELGVQSSSL